MHGDASVVIGAVDDCWIAYDETAAALLEAAALSQAQQQPGATITCQPVPGYTVNLRTMQQTKDATGYQRSVQRFHETIVWCWQETASQMYLHATEVTVGDPKDCWIRYDDTSTAILETAYTQFVAARERNKKRPHRILVRAIQKVGGGSKSRNNSKDECSLAAGVYTVNFVTMTQTKTATGFRRAVQRLVQHTKARVELPRAVDPYGEVPPPEPSTAFSVSDPARFLAIIVPHYNPQRYHRRARLVRECLQRLVDTRNEYLVRQSSLQLHIVAIQVVFDDDAPDIDASDFAGVHVIQRTVSRATGVLWSKEQLINIAWRQLPPCFQHIVWMDGDIAVDSSSTWPEQVYRTLQGHAMAMGQVWETCELLGPGGETDVQRIVTSFAAQFAAGKRYKERSNRHDEYWHPGFCWMATRKALEATQGLIHRTLGSADRHMAMAFLGRASETVPKRIHPNYRQQVLGWQEQVERHGICFLVVPRLNIKHYWHGSLAGRKYEERWSILIDNEFDPCTHVEEDDDTELDVWTEDCPPSLIAAVVQYFEDRQEDSIHVQPVDVGTDTGEVIVDSADFGAPCTTNCSSAVVEDDGHGAPIPFAAAAVVVNDAIADATGQVTAFTNAFSFYA